MRLTTYNSDNSIKLNSGKSDRVSITRLSPLSQSEQANADRYNQLNRLALALQLTQNSTSEEELRAVLATIPENVPPGINILANMREASRMTITGFFNAVRNGGQWDIKQMNSKYAGFGNWHYSVMAKAFGFPEIIAKAGAGFAQMMAGTSLTGPNVNVANLFNDKSFGDDEEDQKAIEEGFTSYRIFERNFANELSNESNSAGEDARATEPNNDTEDDSDSEPDPELGDNSLG